MSGDLLNRIREAESQVALPDKPVERPSIGSVVAKAISIALAVQGVQSAVGVVGGAVGGDAFSIITMAVLLGSVVAMVAKKKLEQRYPPKKLREIPGVDTARLFERAVAASKVTRIEKVRSLLSKTADDAVFWPTSVAALVTAFMATAAAFSSVAAAVASGAIGASIALSIMAFLGAKATIPCKKGDFRPSGARKWSGWLWGPGRGFRSLWGRRRGICGGFCGSIWSIFCG